MYRLYYLCILAAAFFLMIIYDLYAAFLLAMILLLVPLLCLAWGYLAKRSLSCQMVVPPSGERGMPMEVMVSVKGPLLPFLSSMTAFLAGKEYDAYEEEGREIHFLFQFPMAHCGRLPLTGGYISWQDPFGLFHFRQEVSPATVLVLPKRVGQVPSILKSLLSLCGSEEVEYFGATPYKPGDNPHLINWKITARTDDVYIRDSSPADAIRVTLAADYATKEDERDTLGDALYSAGLALTASRMTFQFAWITEKGQPVVETIRSQESWHQAIAGFLRQGGTGALAASTLSPYVPICYFTNNPEPTISPLLHPAIWCSKEDAPQTVLSGRHAIFHALGGTPV